jgi:hypothetical protein
VGRALLISADGHATASRQGFTPYVSAEWRDEYTAYVAAAVGRPEGLNGHPRIDEAVNWDSQLRLADLEGEGTVAEVLFPNALPFSSPAARSGR